MNRTLQLIDGSAHEGGGQILRMAVIFSVLYGIPIRIINIRAGRRKPGLAAQHLKGVEIVGAICKAKIKGATCGSTELEFWPGQIQSGSFKADTHTAGSISLMMQIAIPVALFSPSGCELHLSGGTNAEMAPQIDFIIDIFKHHLKLFDGTITIDLKKRGYFPKGGGVVNVWVESVPVLKPINLIDRGEALKVTGRSFVAGRINSQNAEKMADLAKIILKNELPNAKVMIDFDQEQNGYGDCGAININLLTTTGCLFGGSGLISKKIPSQQIAEEAAREILVPFKNGACVDNYTQDQLIVFMALSDGTSKLRVTDITLHTKTAIYIAELMTNAKFNLVEDSGTTIIECVGTGLRNTNFNQNKATNL